MRKPWDGEVWRVRASSFPNQESCRAKYRQLYGQLIEGSGDISLWSTTNTERDRWLLVICGNPDKVDAVDLGGEPHQLSEKEAAYFCQRRFYVAAEAIAENPSVKEVKQTATYESGGAIQPDGSVREIEFQEAT